MPEHICCLTMHTICAQLAATKNETQDFQKMYDWAGRQFRQTSFQCQLSKYLISPALLLPGFEPGGVANLPWQTQLRLRL
jgi:hypothetical protein